MERSCREVLVLYVSQKCQKWIFNRLAKNLMISLAELSVKFLKNFLCETL